MDSALIFQLLKKFLADSNISETILSLPTDNAAEVFGGIDSMKLRSSMTLFDLVSPKDTSARVLEKYFSGCPENHTISILQRNNEPFA